jgi:hypothetical protein
MIKSIFVRAKFLPEYKQKTVEEPTGETRRGFFGGEKPVTRKVKTQVMTGYSDCRIDGSALAADIEAAAQQLLQDGFEIMAITPVLSGAYNYDTNQETSAMFHYAWGWGYGYGYSYTEGVVITARASGN